MKCLQLNHLPWWIPWWLQNPHTSSWKEGEQSGLLVFCPNTSSGEWVFLLLLCNYSLGPGEIEKVVSLFNSLWPSSSTVLFNLYDCHIIWNAPHIISAWTDHENVLCKDMTFTQRLLCCLPTDDFAICVFYIMYNVQKHRRPLMPMEKAWAPSAFRQSVSLLLWFSGVCITAQVIGRLENMLWVLLHLLMEKERAFPWIVFLSTQ